MIDDKWIEDIEHRRPGAAHAGPDQQPSRHPKAEFNVELRRVSTRFLR
jgi:hypothetical protein